MNDFNSLLLQILEAIGFKEDKDAFIERFSKNIKLQSVANLIKSLPEEKQAEIEQKLKEVNTPEVAKELLNQTFSEQQLNDSLKNATQEALTKYIVAITPTLNETQKNKLVEIFQKLQPPNEQ